MAYFYLCGFMHRLIIPIIIAACVLFRPCGLSGIYLIFLLYIPFVPVPTPKSLKGHTKWFLEIMLILSFLITIAKVTFNVVLLTTGEYYGSWLPYCSTLERAFRTAGFVRLDSISVQDAMTWLSPDIVMLVTTFTYFLGVVKFAVRPSSPEAAEQGTAQSEELIDVVAPNLSNGAKKILMVVGRYLSLSLLCLAGILRPSIPGGVYFIVFLTSATWWGCYRQLNRFFVYLIRGVLVLLLFHIIALYVYQLQWLQELLSGDNRWARYFGLTPLLITDCKDPRTFAFANVEWPSYVNPITLTFLYHVIVLTSANLLKMQIKKKQGTFSRLEAAGSNLNGPLRRQLSNRFSARRGKMGDGSLSRVNTTHRRWQTATRKVRDLTWLPELKLPHVTEYTPLIRGVSPSSRKYGTGTRTSLIAEGTSGGGEAQDDIPMHQLGKGTAEPEYSTGLCEQILFCLASTFDLIVRSSYIATNIIMMVWSITYHSWLTFVLLLWANIMWMLPNQRRTMLRSTPILVFYAEFLLIAQYIFGMNLTDEELPAKIKGFDLAQFGFEKVTEMPCIPLLVKCLYTSMFWITLRQFMKERKEAKQTSTLADMVAPLQVTVSTATTAMGQEEEAKQNKTMEKVGRFVKRTLTTYWIGVVAIMLFVSGITGTHMTGFRIVYMALFLVFIIAFQLSWTIWRRMMYGFWAVVIIYSMAILILVYTYQFNNFDDYWVKYLHIPVQIQNDIGLEKYETKQLFVRLLTPTFFVIITVIQMHYFHQDFLALSDIRSRRRSSVPNTGASAEARSDIRSDTSSAQMGLWEQKTQAEQKKLAEIATEAAAEKDSKIKGKKQSSFVKFLVMCWKHISYFLDLVWLFLELHLLKVVLICGTFLCIFDPCAAHFPIMVMCAIVFACGSKAQNCIKHVVAIMCSVLLLFNMIYQIEYIKHERWNVQCSENATNETKELNGAEWLGFRKTKYELPYQLRWYIVYLVAASAHVVVTMRQLLWRLSTDQRLVRPYVMFPEITRNDADKNVLNCVKFLVNYGFYKFGYEITLMAIVALVGIRMDVYALLYALWLIVFIRTTRKQAAVAWPFFIAFVIVVLPIQYVMVVGLPPWLCITFPWEQQSKDLDIHELQSWLYLLNAWDPPPANKLVCDVIVLMMASRQAVVFRIERRFDNVSDTGHGTSRYPGGANGRLELSDDIDQIQNPVPDFVTYIRSWLDIAKRCVFLSFLWITLAVVFLAGTNRVNVFSIGYLVGSFIFLWLGSDLYLRPIPKIINYWNCLLCYNVFVIIVKVLLQIPGCIFLGIIQEHACWAVQLFAIGCINKFADDASSRPANTYIEGPTCTVPHADVGLFWDGICFGFLILQKRLFMSYYFLHMIDDTKAITILASRGAELIEELRQQQIAEQQVEENNILEKIKTKMDRIKANQQRIQGPGYTESTNHFVDGVPLARSSSMSSSTSNDQTPPAGYHTPISEESPPPPIQAPTPCSALMTVSLDGYLEPQRMSFGSPPSSELIQTQPSLDESFPVFSPPPYGAVVAETAKAESKLRATHQRQASIGPPWMEGEFQTPRQSIISFSSRSPHSHQTYTIFAPDRPMYRKRQPRSYKEAIRSGDYYMFDSYDDEEIDFEINQKSKEKPTEEEELLTRHTQPLGQFLNSALKLDINTVVKSHHQRRASLPASTTQLKRQRSTTSARSHLSDPLIITHPPVPRQDYSRQPTDKLPTVPSGDILDLHKIPDDKTGDDKKGSGGGKRPARDDDAMSTLSAITEPKTEEETWKSKLMTYLYFIWAFLESCMISFTIFLNKFSKDYRYVIRVLTKEKKYLKDKGTFRIGIRRGSGQVWHPIPATYQILKRRSMEQYSPEDQPTVGDIGGRKLSATSIVSSDSDDVGRKPSVLTIPEIRLIAPSIERGLDVDRYEQISESPALLEELQQTEMSSEDQAPIVLMFLSMWYYILAHSDVVCYFMVFLNHIKSASVISLPLPMMVFLWGSLTIPRPTKTFWVTVIAYTEVIVIIKCVFQFELLPWNNNLPSHGTPFFPAKIIGIERKPNYATYDLILLLIVFFHRFMLKSLGLWKSSFDIDATLHEGEYKLEQSSLLVLTKAHDEADRDSIDQDLAFITVTGDEYMVLPTMHIIYMDRYNNRLVPVGADVVQYLLRQYENDNFMLANQRRFFYGGSYSGSKQESSMSIRTPGGRRLTSVSSALHEENERSGATKSAVATTSGYSGRPPDDADKDEDPDNISLTESMAKLVVVKMERQNESENYPVMLNLATSRYFESARVFFTHLLDPTSRVTTDVYAYMFICDFFNFLVTFFGFSAFGSQIGDGGVSAYLKENKVPIPFLMMLILQFMLIIIDRGLYLRKFILGKVVFQYFLIFGVHIWMFFVLPAVTERPFNALLPPQMWYMVKCFYLLLSAYQIRSGYPTRILGNFLCKGYNYVNMVLFKGFMIVPFLFELRTIMDWMWTDTSMTIFDWLKMEDIFAHVFQVKCSRYVEEEYPSPRGEKKPGWVKYLMGGCGLFAIVGIIWFPLVLFALGSTVGQSNLPYDVTLNIRIGPYQPIFSMSAQNNSIFRFTEKELSVMRSIYQPIREADTFLVDYEYTDIAAVKLNCNSTSIWTISPPDQIRLINEINSTDRSIVIRMEYIISRLTTNKENPGVITEQLEVHLPPLVDGHPNQVRVELAQMLKENNSALPPILIQYMLPKFIKVTNIGTAKPVPQLLLPLPSPEDRLYRNITFKLSKSDTTDKSWWEVREDCSGANYDRFLRKLPYKDCDYLVMYTFNEKTFPASLSVFSGGGIIGLYTTLVFVASRVFRGIFSDIFHKIMFEDMPNIDRVLQLCLDIYLVREAKELCLEEDLFAKLVFLFRSPETMIKWTRPKEIGETDDDDPEQLDDNDRRLE